MSKLLQATSDNFPSVLKNNQRVVVDFYADWCGPCKIFAPVFEAAAQFRPEVAFVKLDTEKQSELAKSFKVSSIPTVILFKNGKPEDQFVGYKPKEELLKFIDRHG